MAQYLIIIVKESIKSGLRTYEGLCIVTGRNIKTVHKQYGKSEYIEDGCYCEIWVKKIEFVKGVYRLNFGFSVSNITTSNPHIQAMLDHNQEYFQAPPALISSR